MDYKNITLELLVENMGIFKMLYDIVRIIDPVKKQVLDLSSGKLSPLSSCHCLWNKNKACNNCVSIRAYNENKSFDKVDYDGKKLYMLTAIPVDIRNRRVVIELLKDVTCSGIIEKIDNKNADTIYNIVNNLNNLIVQDPLTEVFNKRFLNERLPTEIKLSSENKEPLSIIMIDLDYFKKVNDTYGHVLGDRILKAAARSFSNCIRKNSDWIARYGGEEFIVCLKNTNIDTAVKVAERMRKTLETIEICWENKKIHITASFGIKTILGQNIDVDSFLNEADIKLYEAKKGGRNKVVF
ncbi:GGDEF domain-containing protein [Clostridium sp. CX1]|uniref:GGDEF domain-containing protein n=1 Tax=Clostridium sp. CX1 TaxID=2978346 RepID=UPI0021BE274B|nr:GGDEF domain-containing protein [Clostridium sp. CX1]MCT8977343.1 GGDEF domain-containing protein [Clostridium sp. CX1]